MGETYEKKPYELEPVLEFYSMNIDLDAPDAEYAGMVERSWTRIIYRDGDWYTNPDEQASAPHMDGEFLETLRYKQGVVMPIENAVEQATQLVQEHNRCALIRPMGLVHKTQSGKLLYIEKGIVLNTLSSTNEDGNDDEPPFDNHKPINPSPRTPVVFGASRPDRTHIRRAKKASVNAYSNLAVSYE